MWGRTGLRQPADERGGEICVGGLRLKDKVLFRIIVLAIVLLGQVVSKPGGAKGRL